MSGKQKKEFVVPKKDAVFWLDAQGRWRNKYGVFEHKKIIDYFHSSIRKDAGGYHVFQKHDDHTMEKVYFKYEDTALFVFGLKIQKDSEEIRLILNTGDEIPLDPEALFVQNDNLYTTHAGHRIKFMDRAMLKLADRLEFIENRYGLKYRGKTFEIPVRT